MSTTSTFAETCFDYVIVGGGNAGIPIAVRLSEDPNVTVGIIEAGEMKTDDPLIDVPGYIGLALAKSEYDWSFTTTPQKGALDRVIATPRGKMVGGSSALNFTAWNRASSHEYDAWKQVSAEPGDSREQTWNWAGLLPYFKRSECTIKDINYWPSFSKPENVLDESPSVEEVVGLDGPVKVSYNAEYTDVHPYLVRGWNEMGVKTNPNPFNGNTFGISSVRRAIDTKTGVRSSATRAYYLPHAGRKNLKLITGALASKLLFNGKDAHGNLIATGVEFIADGKKHVATATREVVLAAGVVQTPQLLELSGIGNAQLLCSLGINVLVDLPGVGENLHDHIFAPIQYVAKPGIKTFDELLLKPEFMEEQKKIYAETKGGWLAAVDPTVALMPLKIAADKEEIAGMLSRLEAAITKADAEGALSPLQKLSYSIQIQWIKDGTTPQTEAILFSRTLVPTPAMQGRNGFVMMTGIQQPFSRGNIHISSTNPEMPPTIDPKYLSWEFDLEMLSVAFRYMEKMSETASMQEAIATQVFPSKLENDTMLHEHIKQTFATGSHIMGSCAMARRDLGGVVSSALKVYGTANVRVADASIIPTPIATHLQATVYAIAEKAVDIIKKGL